jgi:hypothetical protein
MHPFPGLHIPEESKLVAQIDEASCGSHLTLFRLEITSAEALFERQRVARGGDGICLQLTSNAAFVVCIPSNPEAQRSLSDMHNYFW